MENLEKLKAVLNAFKEASEAIGLVINVIHEGEEIDVTEVLDWAVEMLKLQ